MKQEIEAEYEEQLEKFQQKASQEAQRSKSIVPLKTEMSKNFSNLLSCYSYSNDWGTDPWGKPIFDSEDNLLKI